MGSPVFTCTVEQDPCPPAAQQRLDFVGFSLGPECAAIFAVVFVATVSLNLFAWKLSMVIRTLRGR